MAWNNQMEDQLDLSHITGHVISFFALAGSLAGILPVLAGLIAMVWYAIQVYESQTVRHWLANRSMSKKAKRILALRAKEKIIIAELEALELVRAAKIEAREKIAVAHAEATLNTVHDTADYDAGQ
jgi:hypothetical protein